MLKTGNSDAFFREKRLTKNMNDEKLNMEKTILHHKEGVDLIPANIELSAIEVSLVNAMSKELIMRSLIERLREFYDFIIIDCIQK